VLGCGIVIDVDLIKIAGEHIDNFEY